MSHLGKRLSAFVDGELDGAQRDRAVIHLARCERCREEAVSLRTLKQRMQSLGEAAADEALTGRLIAMAAGVPEPTWAASGEVAAGPAIANRPGSLRPLLVAAVLAAGVGIGTAAFVLGGDVQPPGPRVPPAVDVFIVQHAIMPGPEFATPSQPGHTAAP
jgi:anti-sigma factor RsiW